MPRLRTVPLSSSKREKWRAICIILARHFFFFARSIVNRAFPSINYARSDFGPSIKDYSLSRECFELRRISYFNILEAIQGKQYTAVIEASNIGQYSAEQSFARSMQQPLFRHFCRLYQY